MTAMSGECVPYDADLGCVDQDEWSNYSDDLQARAEALAWSTLRHLTGGQVGNCPVLARPCRSGCSGSEFGYGPGFSPVYRYGQWFNVGCGCSGSCSCVSVEQITLPGRVAEVQTVWVDGVELDAENYRLDNGNLLVRTDGGAWPLCQNMNLNHTETGTFAVQYVPGVLPGTTGAWAAGILTAEFAKACSGQKCRLPSSVTSVSRQGVSMDFTEGMFAGGQTGIREVDAYVLSLNPAHRAKPSTVWSPDLASVQTRYSPVPVPPPTP
jgi:hypothetical protein